ncbi:hypothetical protein XF_2275 [Xylella fastidiosa 9a5c]|uniref:Uncharacterized protein n=1 Tax=Xylella fastidiosa (strain 9a5c) TaxID=160492 RepID=Q9PB69_XYLFA|nr:hypothetical protein XF_2275 [Xylella fastidiosa 9a5c]
MAGRSPLGPWFSRNALLRVGVAAGAFAQNQISRAPINTAIKRRCGTALDAVIGP